MTTTWAPTTEQILDLDGINIRADSWRFDLLDRDLEPIGTLAFDADRPPTIQNDATQNVTRSVSSLNLPVDQVNDINPVTDRVAAYMTLQDGAEFELGKFLWAVDNRPRRPWGVERASSLVDFGHILDQPMSTAVGQNKGANLIVVAVGLASALIPTDRITFTSSTAGLDAPVAWPPGKNRLEAINELMTKLGYLPVYFDRSGQLIMRDAPEVSASTEPDLVYELGGRILAEDQVESDDLLDAFNRFVAFESSGQGAAVIGRYDLPSSAPQSIANRGFPVTKVESIQGLQNAAQAVKAARTMALTDEKTYLWQRFGSTADPRHDTWNIIQYLGGIYLEVAWSLVCQSGGRMIHTVRRVF